MNHYYVTHFKHKTMQQHQERMPEKDNKSGQNKRREKYLWTRVHKMQWLYKWIIQIIIIIQFDRYHQQFHQKYLLIYIRLAFNQLWTIEIQQMKQLTTVLKLQLIICYKMFDAMLKVAMCNRKIA